MKKIVYFFTLAILLSISPSSTQAQTLEAPLATQEDVVIFTELKTEYTTLQALIPRIEQTITLLEKRGITMIEAKTILNTAKEQALSTKELFENKQTKALVIKESITKTRTLLGQTVKEIRTALAPKSN